MSETYERYPWNHEELDEFREALRQFEEKLRRAQEPLGKEFEKVLHDNLDDLLVKD